jgi:hypothetical protein
MKLFEVDSPDSNLVLLLRNLVAQADSQNQPSYLSWDALNNLMQNVGEEQFDYDSFKDSYDNNPQVQALIQRFDGDGVELKTKTKNPKKPEGGGGEDNISKMAKAATARRMKESEIREIAALFEALAMREVILSEGRVDEAGIWSGIKSAVGKGISGVKTANDAINRLGQLAQNTAPVQNFDSKVADIIKNIGAKNPQLAAKAQQYGEWAKKNPVKQGIIIGMLTAVASLVAGPAGGAAAGYVLRAGNELLKGEKASTAIGKGVKSAAIGGLVGLGIKGLGDFLSGLKMDYMAVKGYYGLDQVVFDQRAYGTGGAASIHIDSLLPHDMAVKVDRLLDAGSAAAMKGDYAKAQDIWDKAQAIVYDPKLQDTLNAQANLNDQIKQKALDGAKQIGELFKALSAAAQGAVSGASAAAKPAAQKAAPVQQAPAKSVAPAAQKAAPVAPDKRAELQQRRADLQKSLRQQGRLKQ